MMFLYRIQFLGYHVGGEFRILSAYFEHPSEWVLGEIGVWTFPPD